ncbi:DUF1376 domain-containing protein [Pseudomonas fluorescens]|uniref:DUF1376 domain-containing protein n=1 Tax=Pseudomonas fluorescens TaxID=294 RepID=UPI000B0B63F7|nr:DUF1376 domain-containing protein [Pseudomonas fluorescens]
MAALPYMQLYVADYLADTMHLTTEEHGAYLLLIFNYWQTGKPIPKARLARIARIPADRWKEIESALAEFFEDDGEQWIHLRIERDIETVHTSPRGKKLPGSESLSGYKGYVYFVTDENTELVKIGYSKNPWARLSELRRTHGVALSVVATVKTVDKSETTVHAALEKFRSEGEWFFKSDCINDLISSISEGKTTTVADICSYVSNYGSPTTATTNTDTDTDTEETPPPNAHDAFDSRTKFAMTEDWQPNEKSFTAALTLNGLSGQVFEQDQFLEFKSFWIASPDDHRTQAKWEHALVQHLKRGMRNDQASGRNANATQQSGSRNAQDHQGEGAASRYPRPARTGSLSAPDRVRAAIAERDALEAAARQAVDQNG